MLLEGICMCTFQRLTLLTLGYGSQPSTNTGSYGSYLILGPEALIAHLIFLTFLSIPDFLFVGICAI